MWTRATPWLWLCGVTACAPAVQPPSAPARWSVRDGFIRDLDGRAVILRGANVSGEHKHPPYFDFHEARDFARLHTDWGFNAVRFLLQWAAVEPVRGQYDATYLAEVRRRLDWAEDAGLLVVLDMHQDLYGPGFTGGNGAPRWTCDEANYARYQPPAQWFLGYLDPNVVACFDHLWTDLDVQQALAFAWREVARTLGDHPAVLGFDVLNEPFLGSFTLDEFEPGALQPLYELVVPAVRAEAPQWLAFLEPSSMRNLGQATRLAPFPFDGVVYAPHAYDSAAERGNGFDPARRDAVLTNATQLAQEAHALGAALWIGEYGGVASAPGIAEYMTAELDAADTVMAGATYWHDGRDDGYGLMAPDGSEKTILADAVSRPYAERVAGTPLGWSWDATGHVFTLRYRADRSVASPTVISAPVRHWPNGVAVRCEGCTAVVRASSVEVSADTDGEVAVTLSAR